MKSYLLPTGEPVFFDDQDEESVTRYSWYNHNGYAYAKEKASIRKNFKISMHRLIMNPVQEMKVDHIDGNGLNNCRSNLRILSHSQNMKAFRTKRIGSKSCYRGLTWKKDRKRWEVSIKVTIKGEMKRFFVGYFTDEKLAALAWNKKAILLGYLPQALNVVRES